MRRWISFDTLLIPVLIITSSVVRYYTNQASYWHGHFKHLYQPTYALIHEGQFPLTYSYDVPLFISYGPALIYLFAPFLLIFKKLEALIFFSIVLEGAAIYLFYRIGKDFYSRTAGVIASLLYGFSFFVIIGAGDFSNGYLQSPFFLLFVYFLFQAKIFKRPRYLVALFITSAILLQIHLSAFIIIPFLIVILFQRSKREAGYKWIGIVGLILLFMPYILHCVLRDPGEFRIAYDHLLYELKSSGGMGWDSLVHQVPIACRSLLPPCKGWSKAVIVFYGLGIFSTFLFAVRDIAKQRTVSWTKEIIWVCLILGAVALLGLYESRALYHYTNINIIIIAMMSSALGRIWDRGNHGRKCFFKGPGRIGLCIAVISICAINLHASYTFYRLDAEDREDHLGRENIIPFAFEKEAARQIIKMGEEKGKRGSGQEENLFSLLETSVVYFHDRHIYPIAGSTCFHRLLREHLERAPEGLNILASNEYLFLFQRERDARGIVSAERNTARGITIVKYRSTIDPESIRFRYEYEAGWWMPEFNDDHWERGAFPFRVRIEEGTKEGMVYDGTREDPVRISGEEKENFMLWGPTGHREPEINELYFRFNLQQKPFSNRVRLYVCSLYRKTEHLEDLVLFVNGVEVGRDWIRVQDEFTIMVGGVERFLMDGPNRIAVKLSAFKLNDTLLLFDLHEGP